MHRWYTFKHAGGAVTARHSHLPRAYSLKTLIPAPVRVRVVWTFTTFASAVVQMFLGKDEVEVVTISFLHASSR